jgi:flagellin
MPGRSQHNQHGGFIMGISVSTNVSSLTAQRNVNVTGKLLSRSIERLSSGLRINSAKDDAAGLAISDRMTAQVRGLNQAARNANDGISMAQTAEGALQQSTNILQRIRELAVQSANDTNTADDRESLNGEVTQLKAELDRIAKTTAFNGKNVIDGTLSSATFQVGADAGAGQTISFGIASARAADLGTAAAASTTGTAAIAATASTVTINTDLVVTADAEGAAGDSITVALVSDATVDQTENTVYTFVDVVNASGGDQTIAIDGLTVTVATGGTATAADIAAAFETGATVGNAVISGAASGNWTATSTGAGETTFTSTTAFSNVADLADVVVGGGTPPAAPAFTETQGSTEITTSTAVVGNAITVTASAATIAGWSNADVAALISGQSTTSLGTVTATGSNFTAAVAFGATNLAGGADETAASADYAENVATVVASDLSVATVADSQSTIASVDLALKDIATIRGGLGAVQNRFESTIANLMSASENISAARSRILDADFAAETAELTKSQILQQAGLAMLSQANQIPQAALTLLQG